MKLKRKVGIAAIVLGCVLILALLTLPWGHHPQSNHWLHLTGPEFMDRTNAQGVVSPIANLTFSNSGPRQLMFSVDDLRRAAGNARGNCLASLGGFVHLASGASTNLIFPITMTPPG